MGIKTNYLIEIEIDDKLFSIVATTPNKLQKEELDVIVDKNKSLYTKGDSIQVELNEAVEEFEINKHILAHGGVVDKVKVMFEQKTLNKKIFKLKADITSNNEGLASVSESLENIYQKRYEILVSGPDKTELKKEVENKGIAYQIIFSSISELIKEAKEKK